MTNYFFFIFLILFLSCKAQTDSEKVSLETRYKGTNCNREVYGRPAYLDKLPDYLCIPEGYIVDQFVVDSDLDGDGVVDFIAMKYNKKKENQNDGDTTYYNFYYRTKGSDVFKLRRTYTNLVPPNLKDSSWDEFETNKLAADIYSKFPREFSTSLAFRLNKDSLILSYKYADTEGKSFCFLYSQEKEEWYLHKVEFVIGELSRYWWYDDEFYYPLVDDIKTMYVLPPRVKVSIKDFDLIEAFKFDEEESIFISQWLMGQLNDDIKSKHNTISDFEFAPPKYPFDIPEGWKY